MVLTELTGVITEGFKRFGDSDVLGLQAKCSAWQANFGHPCAKAGLAGDERCPSRRAALLGVVVCKHQSFASDSVDVRRLYSHHPKRVGTDVGEPNIITPNDEDVRALLSLRRLNCCC